METKNSNLKWYPAGTEVSVKVEECEQGFKVQVMPKPSREEAVMITQVYDSFSESVTVFVHNADHSKETFGVCKLDSMSGRVTAYDDFILTLVQNYHNRFNRG